MAFFNRDRVLLAAAATAAAALTAAALIASNANAAPAGTQAPEFKEQDSKGQVVQLSDFKGKTVVLEWTNNGCPFVQKQYNSKNMQATQDKAAKDGVVWISVISSRPGSQGYVSGAEADKLTAQRGAHPAFVLLDPDGSMGRAYGAKTTPHMFVITPDGKIAYNGAIDDHPSTDLSDVPKSKNYVLAALDAVAHGKTADPAVTQPYGCSVKY